MAAISFDEARACVLDQLNRFRSEPSHEEVRFELAIGRVLAEPLLADRDYPPLSRSIRDGFAVQSQGFTGRARISGEVRAGEKQGSALAAGEAVEIMTGAPVPPGADAVIMVEHVRRENGDLVTDKRPSPGQFVNPRGSEARAGDVLLPKGTRLDHAGIAAAAMAGRTHLTVYVPPRVAVLATGDEIVQVEDEAAPHQVRNSNSYALAAQIRRAGGSPEILPIARDSEAETRQLIERGLEADMLLLSGGVSAGKYDVVEPVLAALGAEFYFDRVSIQPGQPLVFGRVRDRFFFGLPGNPASTMITFELFARSAVELLGGQSESPLHLSAARLTEPFRHKAGLTRFLPATLTGNGGITPLKWQGSSDVTALARANAFLVAESDREEYPEGEWLRVLPK